MNEDDAWWKFALIYVLWLLASAAIALTIALLVGQLITFFGVDPGSMLRRRVTEVIAVALFIVLAALPFVIPRWSRSGES